MTSFREQHGPIVDAALDVLERALGKPARLRVLRLNEEGRHAFVYASILSSDGHVVDYADTGFAQAAANGRMSYTYAALLEQRGDRWSVLERAVGPTDVAWLGWADAHRVPTSLFEGPTD